MNPQLTIATNAKITRCSLAALVIFVVFSSSCLCLSIATRGLSGYESPSTQDKYAEYKRQFNKHERVKVTRDDQLRDLYALEETRMRLALFEENVKFVEAHNRLVNRTHDLELNGLADWTQDELDSLNGYNSEKSSGSNLDEEENIPLISGAELEKHIPGFLTDDLPEDKDWRREDGVVGPPGDQGNCGSCWAFSIVGMLEGQERKLNGTLRDIVQLSQQQLVDCNLEDRGCSGGRFLTALGYIERAGGLQTYRDYPYESGKSGNETWCRFDETKAFPSTRYLNGTRRLKSGDEELLMRVVAHYGPVSVAIDSTHKEFRLYSKGIHYDPSCTTKYNHSVLIVGYGRSSSGQDYWIVRNSWGKRWGMGGYILMARNRENNCGIASNAVISLANFPNIEAKK